MTEFAAKRALPPMSPGAVIRQILDENGVSVAEAARAMGISRQFLHQLLAGRAAITADTALRLGAYFGNGPVLWLSLQNKYSIYEAENKLRRKIVRIRPLETKCA